jgi:ribosomal protein S12 methylthiotransferase accessory factor
MCFTNGIGNAGKRWPRPWASTERISNNHFYAGFLLGRGDRQCRLRALPQRALVQASGGDKLPKEILDAYCLEIYNPDGELRASHLVDTNSGNVERGNARCLMCGSRMVKCILQPGRKPFVSKSA